MGVEGGNSVVPRAPTTRRSVEAAEEPEVPLQITIPKRVKRALDLKSVETGRTRRALVLEALRGVGLPVSDDEIAGRRGAKKR